MLNQRRVQPWHVAIGLGDNQYVFLCQFILSCSTGVNDALALSSLLLLVAFFSFVLAYGRP